MYVTFAKMISGRPLSPQVASSAAQHSLALDGADMKINNERPGTGSHLIKHQP